MSCRTARHIRHPSSSPRHPPKLRQLPTSTQQGQRLSSSCPRLQAWGASQGWATPTSLKPLLHPPSQQPHRLQLDPLPMSTSQLWTHQRYHEEVLTPLCRSCQCLTVLGPLCKLCCPALELMIGTLACSVLGDPELFLHRICFILTCLCGCCMYQNLLRAEAVGSHV